jgi:hypothetical protein
MLSVEYVQEELLLDAYNESQRLYCEAHPLNWDGLPRTWEPEVEFSWYDMEDLSECVVHGITVSVAEADTGGEGHGEDVYIVFKTIDTKGDTQYWRKDGYYASHYGTDWDGDFREVRLIERIVTFYE